MSPCLPPPPLALFICSQVYSLFLSSSLAPLPPSSIFPLPCSFAVRCTPSSSVSPYTSPSHVLPFPRCLLSPPPPPPDSPSSPPPALFICRQVYSLFLSFSLAPLPPLHLPPALFICPSDVLPIPQCIPIIPSPYPISPLPCSFAVRCTPSS